MTSGPFRFLTSNDLGSVRITIDGDIFTATELSLDGGTTTQPYSILSRGTVSDSRNNNFFKNFSEFSAGDPPDYLLLSSGGEIFFVLPEFPVAAGDLPGNIQLIEATMPCFTPGTRILTRAGERRIEDLAVGDEVLTRHSGYAPIRWIGISRAKRTLRLAPIVIRADALRPGVPSVDMAVSPQHRILIDGHLAQLYCGLPEVLVPATNLVNGKTIHADPDGDTVTYIHIMLDAHDVVFTENLQSETLFLGKTGLAALTREQRAEILAIFPGIGQDGDARATFATVAPRSEAALMGRFIGT